MPPWQQRATPRAQTGFGKGSQSLEKILMQYVLPEIQRGYATRDQAYGMLTGITGDPNYATKWGTQTAEALSGDLFKAGGPIYSEIAKARGGSIGAGFSPEGAVGKVDTILGTAAEGVGRAGLQAAQQAEQMRLGLMGTQYGMENQNIANAISSLYTGWAGKESLRLADKSTQQGWLSKALGWIL